MEANQRIKRYYVKLPNGATSEDIARVISSIKSDTIITPVSQKTYEIRRKQALPFFRLFTFPSRSNNKKVFNIYGKNIFRLFG